jgi:hypothetical protein
MKKVYILLLFIIFLSPAFGENLNHEQNSDIIKILNYCSGQTREEAIHIINYIDDTYGKLYENLTNNGKFTIYFGPAHGKDESGQWRGITTNRIGISGLPEEYYSMIYSRKLYSLLKGNKFIEVAAAPYYKDVLEGKSDSYHYMKFTDVAKNAYEAKAFMVVEMHMNNVSVFEKADGLVNMPGIHMVRDSSGKKLLKNITGIYSGFLTLYNKYDASGFSQQYALNIRNALVAKGYSANGWEYGAVGDDRFSYYLLFPVSVIYECGFISHPVEEKMLRDPYYMDGMVSTQYEMLLKTIKDIYGIDISGENVLGNPKDISEKVELLKLARLIIHFIQSGDVDAATESYRAMKKIHNSASKEYISYYGNIIERVNRSESLYKKGIALSKNKNAKKRSKARQYFVRARDCLNRNVMYQTLKEKYSYAIYGERKNENAIAERRTQRNISYSSKGVSAFSATPSSITKPFVISLSHGETLEHAVAEALDADQNIIEKLVSEMENYKKVKVVKVKKYSARKKKAIWTWEKIREDFEFTPGLYVVSLDKKLNVIKAEKVSAVYLDPHRYQNQQYLKNSYFAATEKEKDL